MKIGAQSIEKSKTEIREKKKRESDNKTTIINAIYY